MIVLKILFWFGLYFIIAVFMSILFAVRIAYKDDDNLGNDEVTGCVIGGLFFPVTILVIIGVKIYHWWRRLIKNSIMRRDR